MIGPLAHLSLVRVRPGRTTPRPLTNEERLAAYRPYMPAVFANARFLGLSEAERYAANESIDNSTPTTDVHYREWTK